MMLHLLDHLPHKIPGLALGLDGLGVPGHLHLEQVLDLADVGEGPAHELDGARLLLSALLLSLHYRRSSLLSALHDYYPGLGESRQRAGTGGVYAPRGGGTKMATRTCRVHGVGGAI